MENNEITYRVLNQKDFPLWVAMAIRCEVNKGSDDFNIEWGDPKIVPFSERYAPSLIKDSPPLIKRHELSEKLEDDY